ALYSVDGNDVIFGGSGSDVIVGDDVLTINVTVEHVTLNGRAVSLDCYDDDVLLAGSVGAYIRAGQDLVFGGSGSDTVIGDVLVIDGYANSHGNGIDIDQYNPSQHRDDGLPQDHDWFEPRGYGWKGSAGDIDIVDNCDTVYGGTGHNVVWGGSMVGIYASQTHSPWSNSNPCGPLVFDDCTGWFFTASNVEPFSFHGNQWDFLYDGGWQDTIYGGHNLPRKFASWDPSCFGACEPSIDWHGKFFAKPGPCAISDSCSWVSDFVNNVGQSPSQQNPNFGIKVYL
ncbi:MAG: hypothetical protein ACREVC_16755, partial [Burkholderiales bacterium]